MFKDFDKILQRALTDWQVTDWQGKAMIELGSDSKKNRKKTQNHKSDNLSEKIGGIPIGRMITSPGLPCLSNMWNGLPYHLYYSCFALCFVYCFAEPFFEQIQSIFQLNISAILGCLFLVVFSG